MKNLLHDLILVPQDVLIAKYEKTVETKLHQFLFDEDNDINTFFPKLKVRMKEKKVHLPLTAQELKTVDKMVIKILKAEMALITAHLSREIKEVQKKQVLQDGLIDGIEKAIQSVQLELPTLDNGQDPFLKSISSKSQTK